MGKTKAAAQTQQLYNRLGTPPDDLGPADFIVKVVGARGNSLYNVRIPLSNQGKLKKIFTLTEGDIKPEAKRTPAKKENFHAQDTDSESESDSEEEVMTEILGAEIVVEMPPKFRNAIFVKRGGFCVISVYQQIMNLETIPALSDYKVQGEISNIVVNDREWQKYTYWPQEFKKHTKGWDISSDEESEADDDEDGSNNDNDE